MKHGAANVLLQTTDACHAGRGGGGGEGLYIGFTKEQLLNVPGAASVTSTCQNSPCTSDRSVSPCDKSHVRVCEQGPRHALARKAWQLIADFVSLSPEQIAAQIEEEGDEDMIFGLGHGYANP